MVSDDRMHSKRGRFVLQGNRVRLISSFLFSIIIGVVYACLIVNETTMGYIHNILPSTDGPDLYQYLPIIVPSAVFSYLVQRRHMIFIENISFSCIQAITAFLSLAASLMVVMIFF